MERDDVTEVISDLHTTANDLHEAADAVQAAEARADMAEETTAIAVAQIDAANERAAEIERAAIETALGVRMTALETEFRTWQENALTSLRQELATLMAPILTQFQEMLTELETEESQPSTPATLETPAEVTAPEEQLREPEKSPENPVPQKPKKLRRWI
jgi:predicted TIM-barrel fold metal-dependent hydrolase